MDRPGSNWTCLTLERDVHNLVDVTLTLLLTLKLGLVGIIYDDSVALEVSHLMPRLLDQSNAVLFLADDIVHDPAVARAYLEVVAKRLDWQSPISLLITRDYDSAEGVFKSFSKHQASLGSQSGVGLFTKWLIIMPCDYATPLEDGLNDFYNVAAVVPNTTSDEALLSGELVVKTLIIKPEGRKLETVGFSRDANLTMWSPLFPNVHRGFNAMHLRVGVYVWSPFTMRIKRNGAITYEGFCVDLVIELARRLNFSFSMVEPADNQWGAPLPDGTWTGVVGMLQKREIDISVAALMITPERAKVMDATFPYYYDNVAVLYKRPDPKENLWQTYFYPFKQQVFMFILISLGVATLLYAFMALFSPRSPLRSAVIHRRWWKVISGVEAHVSQLTYSLVHQSQKYLPSYASGRVFLSFWWIFSILLAATYKGNLMAFLLVAKTERPFTTLWDLGTQDVYKWGVTGSTVVEYLFNISSRPDFHKLGLGLEKFKAIDPETNSTDPEVHLRKVKQGNYAYISDQVPMETWVAVDCDLRILEERVIPLPFIVGLHNNSAYVTAFNEQILDIDQMGLYSQWKARWWPQAGQCSDGTVHDSRAVTLLETQSAFYILCIGISAGGLTLLAEFAWTMGFCVLLRGNTPNILGGKKIKK